MQNPTPQTVEVTLFEAMETVPPSVREYLLSDEIAAQRGAALAPAKLTDQEKELALAVELQVFFKIIPVSQFADALYGALGWNDAQEERVAKLAADIMGKVLFPADAWVGDVAGALQDIGFDPASYPHRKIRLGVRTYDEASKLVFEDAKLVGADEEKRNRAIKVIDSYLRGVRVDIGAKEALTKSVKVGGVGLTDAEAAAVIAAARNVMDGNVLMDEIPVAEHGPEETHGTASQHAEPEKVWDKAAITAAYAGSKEEQDAIVAARTSLRADGDKNVLAKFAGEVMAEENEVANAMAVVAGALMMAEAGVLLKTIKEPALNAGFRTYLTNAGLSDMMERLDKDAEDPALFSHYLAWLLKVKTDLTDGDAARFALKAANAMKKAGMGVSANVAFHPETGEFVWESA